MIKSWIGFWVGILAALFGLTWWKNWKFNRAQSWKWISLKSLVDFVLIVTSAAWMPAFLIAWGGLWLTKPIKHPGLRATVGVIAGVGFAICAAEALEVLALIGIFAVDTVTGEEGFLANWRESVKRDEKRCRIPVCMAS